MTEFNADLDVIGVGMQTLSISAQVADVEMAGVNPSNTGFSPETAIEVDSIRSNFVEQAAELKPTLDAVQTFDA